MKKFRLSWTMTTYYETEVEAESEEEAEELFNEGGLDADIIGDAGDAELQQIEEV